MCANHVKLSEALKRNMYIYIYVYGIVASQQESDEYFDDVDVTLRARKTVGGEKTPSFAMVPERTVSVMKYN